MTKKHERKIFIFNLFIIIGLSIIFSLCFIFLKKAEKFESNISIENDILGASAGDLYPSSGTNISTGVSWTNPQNVAKVESLDQSQTNYDGTNVGFNNTTQVAMVFTAGKTGDMTGMRILIATTSSATESATIRVLATENGLPSSTQILWSGIYNPLTIGLMDIDTSVSPPSVTSGTKYAINIERTGSSVDRWAGNRTTNPYTTGTMFSNTGSGWATTTVSSSPVDAYFQTDVIPSSPDDGQTATVSGLGTTGGPGPTSKLVAATNFGFSIPTGSTVDGIEVELEASASNCTAQVLWLTKDGSNTTGLVKTTSFTSSLGVLTYGGSSDLWSTTWTPAEINASTFGAAFGVARLLTTPACSGAIDYMAMTVYYTENAVQQRQQRVIIIN